MKRYIAFVIALLINMNATSANGQEQDNDVIRFHPIGKFHTSFNKETGAPRQGILMPESKGTIEILPRYHEALRELEQYDYIIVLYYFHEVRNWVPIVHPPSSTREQGYGLFATRTPRRPNPIGFAVIKLERIENNTLHVSGIDAFDGTPVLDIKPYIPSIDCVESIRNEMVEKELGLPE